MADFEKVLAFTLRQEDGDSDDPRDAGGVTRKIKRCTVPPGDR